MKNVKLFEDFGQVNEANSNFAQDVEELWNELNRLYLLQDEGYIIDNGVPAASVNDINSYLEEQQDQTRFDSAKDVTNWVDSVVALAGKLQEKYGK